MGYECGLWRCLGALAAERLVVHDGECRVCDGVAAFVASEAFAVPLGVERDDGLVHDGLAAALAARRELVRVARRAVGSASLFHEAAAAQLLPAASAHKVVRVPRHAESLDHAVSDGFPAAVAARAVVLREARHAVHAAVVLVELGAVDGLAARVAREVLGVPLLVQGLYDPACNDSIAAVADSWSVVGRHVSRPAAVIE